LLETRPQERTADTSAEGGLKPRLLIADWRHVRRSGLDQNSISEHQRISWRNIRRAANQVVLKV